MMNNKWFYREFDKHWVKCFNCKHSFLYIDVKRKNKCPNCKLNNKLELPKIQDVPNGIV